eukprot:180921_1
MCKGDLNYVLAYPTVKMVMVADWRLGALRYTFLIGTALYIFVYALYLQRGYLDIQSPSGTVTATLERPPNANVNARDFAYCTASNASTHHPDPLLCEVWPEDMVLFPTSVHDHMVITTRVSEQWFTINPDCTYQNFGENQFTNCNSNLSYISSSTPKRYLAGVDSYSLQVTHAMLDVKHYDLTGHEKYCLTGEQMEGQLLDFNDNVLKTFPANRPMRVTLSDLLQATGTNLDETSDSVSINGSIYQGESMRHAGIVLMVIINYDNTYGTKNRNPKYTVKAIRIKRAEYKVIETIHYNETYRMNRNRHGVYISFVQGGTIGKLNVQTALISLTASLGLLGVSTLIVDSLMLYYCKKKENYYKDKYNVTEKYAHDLRLQSPLNADPDSQVEVNNNNEPNQPYYALNNIQ